MSSGACEVCPANPNATLTKLGVDYEKYDFVIGLAGNPNTGKSTVFNSLTGLRQHTGNWPGKTVARAEGAFEYSGKKYKIVDLPGTYSLLSTSHDEEIARDFILFGNPDVTVIVADATRIERNLNLVLQVLEITDRAVLCVNLMDEAKRNGISVDIRALSRDLGIPVVPASARRGEGIADLLRMIHRVAIGEYVCKPRRIKSLSPDIALAVDELTKKINKEYPKLRNARWVALRLLEGDQRMIDAIKNGEFADTAGLHKRESQPLKNRPLNVNSPGVDV
ncbi:MAG: 50S ribosome-binding GTPase [Ignavibacteriales bacterium]|nr:MAG: iron transporter FeoB [Ignavibacteriaceae bacterium]MBW7873208.1 50S ribosome-binding GTPase [Ignavibacteria bacterium]MCZ2142850.1 50S ribosome-binding GTPase [Ignavibacteriales bacterium]MBV6443944.1 GTPase Der [Ignavibacteriaceae bacterium]MBZ0197640.1 50S ribosome-binding GTPase [Ignavibacteriaceae bacterium]